MSTREPPPRMCYACGNANEHGLRMQFRKDGDRTICEYRPQPFMQGYPGRMHGGVVSAMIDEAMGWAVYHAQAWGATARLSVRYRQPVRLDQVLRVESWVVRDRARLIELRAELRGEDGALLAEGEGTFMRLDPSTSNEMSELARETGFTDAPEVVT